MRTLIHLLALDPLDYSIVGVDIGALMSIVLRDDQHPLYILESFSMSAFEFYLCPRKSAGECENE